MKAVIVFKEDGNFETGAGDAVSVFEVDDDAKIASKSAIVIEDSSIEEVAEEFELTTLK